MKKLYAALGRILVKESTDNDVSKGGIIIANMDTGVKSGTIIDAFLTPDQLHDEMEALGNYNEDYDAYHPIIEIGETIYFHENSGQKIVYQGEEIRILGYHDILAIESDDELTEEE